MLIYICLILNSICLQDDLFHSSNLKCYFSMPPLIPTMLLSINYHLSFVGGSVAESDSLHILAWPWGAQIIIRYYRTCWNNERKSPLGWSTCAHPLQVSWKTLEQSLVRKASMARKIEYSDTINGSQSHVSLNLRIRVILKALHCMIQASQSRYEN